MAYKLSFTFAFSAGKCHHPPENGKVYGKSKSHPSIVVQDLPYMVGFYLPKHLSGLRYYKRLDPPAWENSDDWCYGEFYTILPGSSHNLLHVHDWMEAAPEGVARLNGKPILSVEEI